MAKPTIITSPSLGHSEFGQGGQSSRVEITPDEEAVVVDVITNNEHLNYDVSGYNVGAVKFRFLTTNIYRSDSTLNWAFPIESNISEYPLRHEIVVVQRYLNRWYYSRKLNTTNLVSDNAMFDLNSELGPVKSTKDKQQAINLPHTANTSSKSNNALGKVFKSNTKVYRLKHFEGDIIFEGRSGHSIRFGSNQKNLAPNLKIRVGQDENAKRTANTPNGLVLEDINLDKSSIYLLSDELVNIKLATTGNKVHYRSILDAPKDLQGSQIIINSDRLVLNSKKDRIFLHSVKGIHLMSIVDSTIDSGRDFISTAEKIHKFVSPQVFLHGDTYLGMGVSDKSEPVVIGATLAQTLEALLTALIQSPQVITPVGPGTFQPSVMQGLQKALQAVRNGKNANINSKKVFTSK